MPPTPMMAQYQEIKKQYPDCILFFRLGDFYEMFGPDAKEGSKILDIVLTRRGKGEHQMPMCGVPFHAADNYIAKFTRAGRKVAICEQLSDPGASGIVERGVVRVITPGTTLNENILDNKTNQYIAAIFPKQSYFGIAHADATTGEFQVSEVSGYEELADELRRIHPKECIIPPEAATDENLKTLLEALDLYVYPFATWNDPYQTLTNHFQTKNLEGFGIEKLPFGICAAGMLFSYIGEMQKTGLSHIKKITGYTSDQFMHLDEATIRNLELLEETRDKGREGSLLAVMDKTLTSMGGRLLRKWIIRPLTRIEPIEERLSAITDLVNDQEKSNELRALMENIHDIERITGRIGLGAGNARDLTALSVSLSQLPKIKDLLAGRRPALSALLSDINGRIEPCPDVIGKIESTIVPDPPISLKDGGLVCEGASKELDTLRSISRQGKNYIKNLQAEEIKKTGVTSLKIGYNKVFGYYIEISKANAHRAPETYIRRQTLANCERYITPELKEYENTVLGAEEKIKNLEYALFCEVRDYVAAHIKTLQQTALALAELDVLRGLADVAVQNNYCKPVITRENIVTIKNGRHPVMEQRTFASEFVPNDVVLDEKQKLILVTGPNMGGKSTFLRQIALIALMAHAGSFVPADSARIGLCDRIFTRVGASDSLIRGQSTFMVEMQEAANILNNATGRSLIILDEIGRGTSTYDGVSIAWAITEYLHDKVCAKTVFATHYHELISVVSNLNDAVNYSVAVREARGGVVFLYKIVAGGVDKSYGIEVAKLAGLPREIVDRAKHILTDLEENVVEKGIRAELADPRRKVAEGQTDIWSAGRSHRALEELKELDINQTTPLEALRKLHELKNLGDQ